MNIKNSPLFFIPIWTLLLLGCEKVVPEPLPDQHDHTNDSLQTWYPDPKGNTNQRTLYYGTYVGIRTNSYLTMDGISNSGSHPDTIQLIPGTEKNSTNLSGLIDFGMIQFHKTQTIRELSARQTFPPGIYEHQHYFEANCILSDTGIAVYIAYSMGCTDYNVEFHGKILQDPEFVPLAQYSNQ